MKKIFTVLTLFFTIILLSACSSNSTTNGSEKNSKVFESEKIENINITSENLKVLVLSSSDDKIHIDFPKKYKVEISDKKDLTVKANVKNSSQNEALNIYLPNKKFNEIKVASKNNNVDIFEINTKSIDVKNENGQIVLKNIKNLSATTLSTTKEKIELFKITSDVVVATNSNGKIFLDNLEANTINLKTNDALISGTIHGFIDNYKVTNTITNGGTSIANTSQGEKILNITNMNADVDLKFVG